MFKPIDGGDEQKVKLYKLYKEMKTSDVQSVMFFTSAT